MTRLAFLAALLPFASHPRHARWLASHIGALVIATALLLAFPAMAQASCQGSLDTCGLVVERVDPKHPHDGDGFHVAVRLYSVDTPERGSRAKCAEEAELAERAWEMTKALLREPVTLTVRGVDRSGRLLADVTLPDGDDLGERLKAAGLARDWPLERAWCE